MALHVELEEFLDRVLDCLDAGIAKLHHPVTVEADQVIVLATAEGPLIERLTFSKLMTCDEVGLGQEVERIINGGPAYRMALLPDVIIEGLHIVMPGCAVDHFQNGIALRGFPKLPRLQIIGESFFDFVKDLILRLHGPKLK